MPVYLTLQPIRRAAGYIAIAPGGLLPHLFTLTTKRWRLFSVTLLHPREWLPVRKYGALRCPDFPLADADKRQATALLTAKV